MLRRIAQKNQESGDASSCRLSEAQARDMVLAGISFSCSSSIRGISRPCPFPLKAHAALCVVSMSVHSCWLHACQFSTGKTDRPPTSQSSPTIPGSCVDRCPNAAKAQRLRFKHRIAGITFASRFLGVRFVGAPHQYPNTCQAGCAETKQLTRRARMLAGQPLREIEFRTNSAQQLNTRRSEVVN